MILLFLVSKFQILVRCPCNIRFCCVIILTEWMTKYQSEFDAIPEYQKNKIPLQFQSSTFRSLSLPLGIKPLPCDSEYWQILNFQSCQCLRLSTRTIKRLLPPRFVNHYRLFQIIYSALIKRLQLTDTSPNHWTWKCKFLSKPCC